MLTVSIFHFLGTYLIKKSKTRILFLNSAIFRLRGFLTLTSRNILGWKKVMTKRMTREYIHISQLLNDQLRCGFRYLVPQSFCIHKIIRDLQFQR